MVESQTANFMVGSQIGNLTSSLSFCHNLCCRCPNGSCEPILDIYTSISFQWYKEIFNARCFDLYNYSLTVQECIGTPTLKMEAHLEVWIFILTLFHTLLGLCPRLGSRQSSSYALTNLLFSLYRSVWVINLLVILLSPYPWAPTCPFTPEMLRARECAPIPYPSAIFTFKFTIESTKKFGGASTR
jgi:hypothetical protein